MAISPLDYLDLHKVDYALIPHLTSYTAQDTASKANITGKSLSKIVVVNNNDKLSMVVIPANCILMQRTLAQYLGSSQVVIVPEYGFKKVFQGCEVGAMPALGNIYGMDVLIAKELVEKEFIIFNSGTHKTLIRMKTSDFMRISFAQTISDGYKVASLARPVITHLKNNWQWA